MNEEAFFFRDGRRTAYDRRRIFLRSLPAVGDQCEELRVLRYQNYKSGLKILRQIRMQRIMEAANVVGAFFKNIFATHLSLASPDTALSLFLCTVDCRFNSAVSPAAVADVWLQSDRVLLVGLDPAEHASFADVQRQFCTTLSTILPADAASLPTEVLPTLLELNNVKASHQVLVVVEDADEFQTSLLNKVLLLCSTLRSHIRLTVVIFWRKTVEEFELQFTAALQPRFAMQVCPFPCSKRLQSMAKSLAHCKDMMFRLDKKTLNYVINYCSEHESSGAMELYKLYKLSMLEHFRSNRTAFCSASSATWDMTIDVINKSWNNHPWQTDPSRGEAKDSFEKIRSVFTAHMAHEDHSAFATNLLWIWNIGLPNRPFGHKMDDMIGLLEDGGFVGSKRWYNIFSALGDVEEANLESLVDQCISVAENNGPRDNPIEKALKEWKQRVKSGSDKQVDTRRCTKLPIGEKLTLQKLQRNLLEARRNLRESRYRTEGQHYHSIGTAFAAMLKPESVLPLFSATHFTDTSLLQRCVEPNIWEVLKDRITAEPQSDTAILLTICCLKRSDSQRMTGLFADFRRLCRRRRSAKAGSGRSLLARFLKVMANFEYVGLVTTFKRGGVLYCRNLFWV